ncbi:hypothetical protein Poli38472_011134 [Pythium oligandrum]|uniref:ABC transporter domain-containing protein n=1 Tax=Pythium oligandrum TaxID=41045 RepID=A0A8K1FNN5_PYTOL|nr:hypothetical protein Poli38472_011134 [Pythium oligandrum]|eukprot:TMW67514.1 hypothetical protein Poli38472_011134 [Pythium oligandrum]
MYLGFMSLAAVFLEYKRYESPEHVGWSPDESSGVIDASLSTDSDFTLIKTPRENRPSNYIAVEVSEAGHTRFFKPMTLAFKDLWYSVSDPKNPNGASLDLLKGISGFAVPGSITALMGSSGAGKTTLMDVIAGRKTGGSIKGQILLNGHPASDLAIRRATGYCEQMDIHSEASTIREALTFSAFLRQGSDVPDSQKYDSVDEVLYLLDLRPIADQIIRGSSVEQMKRLTIDVELAAQPSMLFLDEPTSGLDARSAKVIMDGVRKVAKTGRTVVCTIHQPSWEVFSVFDSLLLLKHGGETVYFGELGAKACELVKYFESIKGVTPLEEGYNPATWMLEVIGAGIGNTESDDTDFVSSFKSSKKKALLDERLARPAAIAGVMVNVVFFLLMGFNPPAKAIPAGYQWLYHLTPHKYSFAILSTIVFGSCPGQGDSSELACHRVRDFPPSVSANLTVKEYIEEVFLIKHSEIWMNVGILVAFIVFFRVVALLALRFINHQSK